MADAQQTITVTNDYVADELGRLGQRILDLSMKMRTGFEVEIGTHQSAEGQPSDARTL